MSAFLLEVYRTVLFFSPLPCPTWRSCQISSCGELLWSVVAVVGLKLLATTFADKHCATVLPNYVLVRPLLRLKSLFTYITGVNPLCMLLKADPSLEGDTADDKADPSACNQLSQVLQYF